MVISEALLRLGRAVHGIRPRPAALIDKADHEPEARSGRARHHRYAVDAVGQCRTQRLTCLLTYEGFGELA